VISQALVPEGRSEDLAACARGEHDEHFREFAKLMILKGRGDSIVRLGWEFNGEFMPWAATDTEVWKACYRRAALTIRSVCPRVKFDWTINSHGTPPEICGGNSLNCYPGDDVVDIIGIDNYDMSPSAKNEEEFKRIAAEPDGLSWVHAFAKKRGKRFSVGEWGIAPTSKHNTTGENPEFIRWMHNWFAAHSADLDYEMYFNECDGGVGTNLRQPAGPSCKRYNALAARVYRELFGGQEREREPVLDPGMTPLERERLAGETQAPLAQ
jgi:hypothetical protein